MVSTVPAEIAGIGSTQQKLRVSPGFDPLKSAVGPEEYFVLSRIDGSQTVREVLLTTGLPVDRSVQIISRLRAIGALLLPHEATPQSAAPTQPIRSSGSGAIPVIARTMTPTRRPPPVETPPLEVKPSHDLALPDPTSDELAALGETNALTDSERRRILAMARLAHHTADASNLYALLGVPQGANARMLKLAYFQLSKEIHPDRYYGKQLGSFADRMSFVFDAASRAYATLTGTNKARGSSSHAVPNEQPQTPQEYAAELFDRACQLEVGGDALEAMKLFAAAVRVDSQPRYLRRAASCALAAAQPRSALEYAKKAHALAPTDASSARLLASAFRAAGKLADAEEVLVMAMALKNENDVLTSELRNDLAEVRRLLTQ